MVYIPILLTKTIAAQSDDALSYYTVRGLHFLAVVFVRSIIGFTTTNIMGNYSGRQNIHNLRNIYHPTDRDLVKLRLQEHS